MGARSSRARSKVQDIEGVQAVVAPPAQKQTASAPPTPQHPEGTPRAESPSRDFPPPPGQERSVARSQTLTEAWMPGPHALRSRPEAMELNQLPGMLASPAGSPVAGSGYPPPLSEAVPSSQAVPPPPGPAPAASPPTVDTEPQPSPNKRPVTGGAAASFLDVPLEEVLQQATEAFGQIATALSSTKWDRRVQALKGVTTVLKGLDIKVGSAGGVGSLAADSNASGARGLQLRDHARCFNAACLILHIVMRDKVLPVLVAAHELYRVTFEHGRAAVTEAEASRFANALFPHIVAKLGELNIRLHESACTCVLFTAAQPFFGVPLCLSRLLDVVEGRGAHQAAALRGQQKMRVHYGVLQAVEMLIKKSPGRREQESEKAAVSAWTPADITPFIVSGLQADSVTGARVQQASLSIAMSIYMILGKVSLLPALEQLSPAGKDILIARLEEEGEDMDEDMEGDGDEDCIELTGSDGFCIMGVGLRPHPDMAISKPITTDGEECLMDEILEDTGLVFGGKDLAPKQKSLSALDEELKGLGFLD